MLKVSLDRIHAGIFIEAEQVEKKLVRVLSVDTIRMKSGWWEVVQVKRDNGASVALYCCRQHVPVLGVGKN